MSAQPQLTVYDGGGYHNSDLQKSYSRVISDGSWKKQRVVIVMPAADMVPFKTLCALRSLGFPPNQGNTIIGAEGMEVGKAYSDAIAGILAHPDLGQWEYMLTMEHDNLPPPDGLMRLVRRMEEHPEFSCIGGAYWTKGPQGVFQAWGDPRDPVLNFRPQAPDPNGGLVECNGTGMGFNLWRLKMFRDERLRKPWFETKDGCTQDLYFWTDAKKYGYRCAIDCSVKVGHLDYNGTFGPKGMVW